MVSWDIRRNGNRQAANCTFVLWWLTTNTFNAKDTYELVAKVARPAGFLIGNMHQLCYEKANISTMPLRNSAFSLSLLINPRKKKPLCRNRLKPSQPVLLYRNFAVQKSNRFSNLDVDIGPPQSSGCTCR